jgi:hypothetical protein
MSSTPNSKLNKKTSSNKENNDKQIFERTADAFFANDLDRRSAEGYIFKLLSSQIPSPNKEKSNKEMPSTPDSELNRKTSSNKKNNDKQIFERTVDAFFANDLDRRSAEEYIFKLFDDMID